jgi:alpha-L-glutamate ligase-like protein
MRSLFDKVLQLRKRRDAVYGINRRNVELVYRHNPRRYYPLADDKLIAKEYLSKGGVAVLDNLAVCANLGEVSSFVDQLSKHDQFVIKPARSSGGRGLVVVCEQIDATTWRTVSGAAITGNELGRQAANIVYGVYSKDRADRAFAEPRVIPHPVYAEFWSAGLCDIRVITLEGRAVLAMVRVPTLRSQGRANLHQGGLGLAVDLQTGRTTRAVHRGQAITLHPESKASLIGIQLPVWPEVLRVAELSAASVPLGYLGVDLVVDAQARVWVLEINVRPGLEIQNVNATGLGSALERAS